MTDENPKPKTAADQRKAKLAAELRANLLKRKAQTRARRDGPAPESDENAQAPDDQPK